MYLVKKEGPWKAGAPDAIDKGLRCPQTRTCPGRRHRQPMGLGEPGVPLRPTSLPEEPHGPLQGKGKGLAFLADVGATSWALST